MRYQVAIWVVGLLTTTGAGAWLAWTTPVPLVWTSGALVGGVLGIAVVAAYVHTFGTDPSETPARR